MMPTIFIKWRRIARFIKRLFSSPKHALLLKKIDVDNEGHIQATLQVVNSPIFFTCAVKALVRDEHLLYKLPPQHIKPLVILASSERSSPTFEIRAINRGNQIILISELATGHLFEMSISELDKNPELIENLSKKDAFLMGSLHNEYLQALETEELKKKKSPALALIKSL